jgi:hypothetical protein
MKIDPAARAAIHELRATGLTMQAIADKVGCSLTTVWHQLHPDQAALREYKNAGNRSFVDRRRKKIQDIKLALGCADCGYDTYPEALDFDHRPGTEKLITIGSQLKSGTWQSVLDEIAKCDVVCANCHRHRTKLRRCPE